MDQIKLIKSLKTNEIKLQKNGKFMYFVKKFKKNFKLENKIKNKMKIKNKNKIKELSKFQEEEEYMTDDIEINYLPIKKIKTKYNKICL